MEQLDQMLRTVVDDLAVASVAMTWPKPKEVAEAIRRRIPPRETPRVERRIEGGARHRCDPPYDDETLDMARSLAASVNAGAPPGPKLNYDFVWMAAVREGLIPVSAARGWISLGRYISLGGALVEPQSAVVDINPRRMPKAHPAVEMDAPF
jgi:hypothetical protein